MFNDRLFVVDSQGSAEVNSLTEVVSAWADTIVTSWLEWNPEATYNVHRVEDEDSTYSYDHCLN